MITYRYEFPFILCMPDLYNLHDVVVSLSYILEGSDENYTYQLSGQLMLEKPQTEKFIPIEELSTEIFVNWIETTLGTQTIDNMKSVIAKEIEIQKTTIPIKRLIGGWIVT
jgi:hypothetical protein